MNSLLKFSLNAQGNLMWAFCMLIILFNWTTSLAISHQEKYKDKCNVDLVRAYGMVGRKTPNAARLEMCPGIRQSCCLKKDQLMMYNQWVNLKEDEFIENRYNHNKREYIKFLNLLVKADKVIEDIQKKLDHRRISNCRELAKRINNFEVPLIVPKIKKNLDDMRDFMITAYKGFYCSICNHDNHPHIDTSKKTITYSEAFCRTTVEETLMPMLFLHVDIVKYVNMVSKFFVSCDFKGDYDVDALIPKKHIFFTHQEDVDKLSDCRNNRNKKEWMAYCSPYCQHFSAVNLDLFYEPNIEKVEEYIIWIEEQIHEKKTEHHKHPMFKEGKKGKKGKEQRILEEKMVKDDGKDKKDERKLDDKKKKKAPPGMPPKHDILDVQVFKSKMTSKVDLTGYMINFAEDGVNLFSDGANAVITNDMYNEVKTLMHLTKMTKKSQGIIGGIVHLFGGNQLDSTEKKEINTKNSGGMRFLKGTEIWSSIMSICMIILVMNQY